MDLFERLPDNAGTIVIHPTVKQWKWNIGWRCNCRKPSDQKPTDKRRLNQKTFPTTLFDRRTVLGKLVKIGRISGPIQPVPGSLRIQFPDSIDSADSTEPESAKTAFSQNLHREPAVSTYIEILLPGQHRRF
jgi:hypothetical protein